MDKNFTRENILMDFDWRFALEDDFEFFKDNYIDSGYFSYFAKTGYGNGAASYNFDDRSWRLLDIPYDWCVELPFDSKGGHSHGFKAIGPDFPKNSIGWYRKSFFIPESDLGRRISIEFDGVHRNSIVWINGFYLGTENSGYTSFSYDITDYLNYGSTNVISVRVDAMIEEGWYYEGAGIYRHVRLLKTDPLHVARYGTFITTELKNDSAILTIRTTVVNQTGEKVLFDIEKIIRDKDGIILLSNISRELFLKPGEQKEFYSDVHLDNPGLWSIENPCLHKLEIFIHSNGMVVDNYETVFGIRTVRFDPDEGFFLNDQPVKIVGTNLHQDHAGVGTAVPDALQEYRVRCMKEMGSNGIRSSHNPPAPEFLDACDRLGMLVIDENRLMGCNQEHFQCLERMMLRDRNHPCVVLWSLGNEEWAIESNIKGARITQTMQTFAQTLDSSRAFTVAVSGGWDNGSGKVIQVMGYNYLVQGDIDLHHKKFPWQAGIGTEETTTHQTRGVYETGDHEAHTPPVNRMPENVGTETGWQFYAARKFLCGLFYWTGFDYRGESNPFTWPAVINQSGVVDLCGFPKDGFYYLKSWWGKEPVLHIATHWNWKGREGEKIKVTVYSNCEDVALFLNEMALGVKKMTHDSHLEWEVEYTPGILSAYGYTNGKQIKKTQVVTWGEAAAIMLFADKNQIKADRQDVSIITVQVNDTNNSRIPKASNEITFSITGPARIIGVGNGDPISHEDERFFENVRSFGIHNLKELAVDNLDNRPEVAAVFDDSAWKTAFKPQSEDWQVYNDPLIVVRGIFTLPAFSSEAAITLFTKSIVDNQSIYLNGHLIAASIQQDDPNQFFHLDHEYLKHGINTFAVVGLRFKKTHKWEILNIYPGQVQVREPAKPWKRKLFNGLAQIIIQSTGQPGTITLTGSSPGLTDGVINIETRTDF